MKTIRIIISGKVQGVYYRQSTKGKALELSVGGTVKNLAGGEVEIIVSGDHDSLKSFVEWCRVGPPKAIVNSVKIEELPFNDFKDFVVIR